jgi:hypothetical protein
MWSNDRLHQDHHMLSIQKRTVGGGVDCSRPLNRRQQRAQKLRAASESGCFTEEFPAGIHCAIIADGGYRRVGQVPDLPSMLPAPSLNDLFSRAERSLLKMGISFHQAFRGTRPDFVRIRR